MVVSRDVAVGARQSCDNFTETNHENVTCGAWDVYDDTIAYANSPMNCCTPCLAEPICFGFSISGPNCWLHRDTQTVRDLLPTCTSWLRQTSSSASSPPPPASDACDAYDVRSDTEVLDASEIQGALNLQASVVPHDCCSACSAAANCGGFTLFANTCYFKRGNISHPSGLNNDDRTGYIRRYAYPPHRLLRPSRRHRSCRPCPRLLPPTCPRHHRAPFICAGTLCLVRTPEFASLNTLNWVVEKAHSRSMPIHHQRHHRSRARAVERRCRERGAERVKDPGRTERCFLGWQRDLALTRRATIELRTPDSDPSGTGLMEANAARWIVSDDRNTRRRARSQLDPVGSARDADGHDIVVKDADWREEDKIAIGGWNPSRGRNLLTPACDDEPKNFGGTGLRTVNATLQLETTDHSVAAFEKGMILINGDQHLKVHCNDALLSSLHNATGLHATGASAEAFALRGAPIGHPRAARLTDDDEYACCVYAAKAQTGAARC